MASSHTDSVSSMDKADKGWDAHTVPVANSTPHGKGETALAELDGHDAGLSAAAARAREAETSLGLWQAFKAYRWAVFWSITVSMVGSSSDDHG